MNWGKGVVIAFVCFIGYIMYFVISAFQMNFDMVTDNYYGKELDFENKQKRIENFRELGKKVEISQQQATLTLDYNSLNQHLKGEVYFYHPASEKNDFRAQIVKNQEGKQVIPKQKLQRGMYKIILEWEVAGKEYYQQEQIYIQ